MPSKGDISSLGVRDITSCAFISLTHPIVYNQSEVYKILHLIR